MHTDIYIYIYMSIYACVRMHQDFYVGFVSLREIGNLSESGET